MALTLNRVLTLATSQKGVKEEPLGSNHTKYGVWYGFDRQPWCAMFVSWCFRENLALILGKFARTDTKAAALNSRGLLHKGATGMQKGDVVFFAFYGSTYQGRYRGIHHTGICLGKLADGRYICIEGNTDNQVAMRYRAASGISAYFRPKYPTVVVPTPTPTPVPTPTTYPVLKVGSTGSYVKLLQTRLNIHGAKLTVDSEFGPATLAAVKTFQKVKGLAVDGIVGKNTWAALIKAPVVFRTGTVIAQSGLNIRKGPSTSYPIIGKLTYGAKVTIVSSTNSWHKIKFGTGYGYVAAVYIK